MYTLSMMLKPATLVTGLYAAWLWWRASKVPTLPDWMQGIGSEPVDPDIKAGSALTPLMLGVAQASALNARAARWTAVSVGLNAIVSFMSC